MAHFMTERHDIHEWRGPALRTLLLRWSADGRTVGDQLTGMTMTAVASLSRMRRQCRMLSDAYGAAEDKHEIRAGLQATLGQLRAVHRLLPPSLREKSWLLTMEYHQGIPPELDR